MEKQIFAEWNTKYINDLPDSAFMYVSPGGKKDSSGKTEPRSLRHLPYKDAGGNIDMPHVRNALARLSNTNIPESVKAGIQSRLESHMGANKASSRHIGVFKFEFDTSSTNSAVVPEYVHLIPTGVWEHDEYGGIKITQTDIQQFADNFNAHIRKGVPITAGHEGEREQPAVGWITKVEARETGLWGLVEWNNTGKALIADRAYKFFSPEYYTEYEDSQTHQIFKNVIVGGALTKSPYFKELEAVVFSEPEINNQINQEKLNMEIKDIVVKDIATLTSEDKAFLKDNATQLTDEQKVTYASVITPEAPKVEDKPTETPVETKPTETPAPTDKPVEASEKKGGVMISASELQMLRDKADKGQEAFAELQRKNTEDTVTKMIFTDTNGTGRFLPKSKDSVKAFIETLNATQRTQFTTLVAELPKANIFNEIGANTATEGTAETEVESKIKAKMSEDKSLSYSSALRVVMSENVSLGNRYDQELARI